uniref:Glycosyltransferase n=1 Tax=Polygala tenuifolia TaxID=355332 RepID=A0A3G3NBY5_9FABA|nr:UDP-glucosyltransferase UGT72AJ3 [Polygala tenuifolia]
MDFDRSNSKPHVAILASPGLGHLIPVIELGKRFVTQHNFNVTLFVAPSPTSKAEAQQLQSATTPKIFDIVELPPIDISNIIEPGAAVVRVLRVIMREIRQSLRSAISNMQSLPNALIVDLFGTESMSIAEEFNMLKYIFLPANASFLALTIYTPFLDKQVEGEYEEQKEVLRIPGCSPVRPEDVVDPMLDRSNLQYHEYVQMGVEMAQGHVDGFLLNTWEDLQPKEMKAFRDDNQLGRIVKAPVYPVGPLVRPSGSSGRSSARKLFDWLDIQPSKSVIYVSFGSGGTLSYQQVTEIAWGLELSQKRFVWVVRPPSSDSTDAAFFHGGGDNRDPCTYLPEGFTKRTQHVGIVIPMWAPQMDILSHPSIGGFLSHCGWNSTLESLLNGVRMIAWPLYAEQRLNARLLTDGLGVAVQPKELPVKREVGREEIEEMVRKVMEDGKDGIRSRVNELKNGAQKALCKGGSSYDALYLIVKQCEQKLQIVE